MEKKRRTSERTELIAYLAISLSACKHIGTVSQPPHGRLPKREGKKCREESPDKQSSPLPKGPHSAPGRPGAGAEPESLGQPASRCPGYHARQQATDIGR